MKVVTIAFVIPALLEDRFEHLNNGYTVLCDTDKATLLMQELADHAEAREKMKKDIAEQAGQRVRQRKAKGISQY